MEQVEYSTKDPFMNVALDEILLLKAERGEIEETVRFWKSDEYFVVLGRGSKAEEDCHVDRCALDEVKILRRISGGGTVLQGPGCFNYSLILSYQTDGELCGVNSSYRYILGKIVKALDGEGFSASFLPVSDLAVGGKKISGNAQARKKKYLLHHGTFLDSMDISAINKYLKHPPKEPGYREGRAHGDFLTNTGMGWSRFKKMILEAFL
ncbi:MAG: lipoate--protein ligase family protein [Candidatus Omnitrophica bacterium]|nr:lipoate--protein ligase family protein [Candidatus Omnitrophota bacterium]